MRSQSKGFMGEKIVIDLVQLKPSTQGFTKVLTMVDVWSGYAACVPLRGATAKEVAEALIDGWICHHSVPMEIQSDNGPEFSAELTKELCRMLEVVKIEASPWSPWSSGKVERYNKTLKEAIAKELKGENNDWDKILQRITFYYNATIFT